MDYKYAILERYPAGDYWTHYFHSLENARWNLEALRETNPIREYVAIGFDE